MSVTVASRRPTRCLIGTAVAISGGAKSPMTELLKSFGWHEGEIVELGDIAGPRGTEMLLPLWLRVWQKTWTSAFN